MSKFKENEVVIYQNGDHFELGVVKKVVPKRFTKVTKTTNAEMIGEDNHYSYFVLYHIGETAALTDEDNLRKISNEYAFLILRRSVEEEKRPAKELASYLISCSPIKFKDDSELYVNVFAALINSYEPGKTERIETL